MLALAEFSFDFFVFGSVSDVVPFIFLMTFSTMAFWTNSASQCTDDLSCLLLTVFLTRHSLTY